MLKGGIPGGSPGSPGGKGGAGPMIPSPPPLLSDPGRPGGRNPMGGGGKPGDGRKESTDLL